MLDKEKWEKESVELKKIDMEALESRSKLGLSFNEKKRPTRTTKKFLIDTSIRLIIFFGVTVLVFFISKFFRA